MTESSPSNEVGAPTGWRHALATYTKPRVLQTLALGFASGLPFLLTYSTLSAWLATNGVRRAAIGTFALVGTPYAFKFLWAPLMDRVPPPLPLGRRRGWGITVQILLMGAILALGMSDPKHNLPRMAMLAVLVAFLSASQDIAIDAWRVESLTPDQQAPGAAMIQSGYRIAMLVSGAGGLLIANYAGWFAAYATMAALVGVGMLVFLLSPEPKVATKDPRAAPSGWKAVEQALVTAVIGPFRDFMRRPLWPLILICIFGYKLGEAMAGVMSTPLYISLGFSLPEIAFASKVFGFFSIVTGALLGGVVTTRFGIRRSLDPLRCLAVDRQPVLRAAGRGRASHRLPGPLRDCREPHRRHGRNRAGDLPFQSLLSGLHGDSICAARRARVAGPHRCRLLGRSFVRKNRLGPFLSGHQHRRAARCHSSHLDRPAGRYSEEPARAGAQRRRRRVVIACPTFVLGALESSDILLRFGVE